MKGWLALVMPAVLTACPATSDRVRGPDGDWWWSISCHRSQSECWEEASEDCPHGYITADETGHTGGAVAVTNTYGNTALTTVHNTYRGEMLIKCKSDGDEGVSSSVRREERQEEAVAAQKDYTQCNTVFEHFADNAALWAEWFPHGPVRDRSPSRSAFMRVCGSMSDDAQLCLVAAYAHGHEDTCKPLLTGLPTATRGLLDHLFLQVDDAN
ncbi:MAG TPA: hypothetical protein VF765_11825 [Polyangiaceae bacterium]